ncbi:MAG TPA: hypothetical protein EYN68_11445, partial [Candidatus Marinimicrobia bacterium]|nr:hypothetical protein [Candidatus Neomarinimicrobiota bacterium]
MSKTYVTGLIIFVPCLILGQISFTAHTITKSADEPYSVYAVDVNGDGYMDVLSASYNDDTIAWYENDGSQNFTANIISSNADGAASVYAVDVDGDGDVDVLSASRNDDKIAWYENDGSESFTAHTITTDADYAVSVYAMDVDSDGDVDVLSASREDDTIAWYENDGSESFTTHGISTSADAAVSVYAVDVDSDGDVDVLSASYGDDKIAWYENDGLESFTTHAITTSADAARCVYAVDVDSDGDVDVLSASRDDDTITWYENDGSESFTAHTIINDADHAVSVYAVDIDGDSDVDVLSASYNDDTIAWYENDGSQNFTANIISSNADGAASVYAVDVDGDGDVDVLSASRKDDTIAWYENSKVNAPADTIAPAIIWSPVDASTDVPVASNVTITFNELVRNIDNTDLTNTNVDGLITLKSDNANGSDISFEATITSNTVITIDPINNFVSNQTVYAAIGATLEDYSDNAITASATTFKTAFLNLAPLPFDLVYPYDDMTIVLTRDNSLDTLYFAWNESVDPNGDQVTYKRELTGDLPEYIRFIVLSNEDSTSNMYKVPYHHIEHYMHEAGVELITGTWTIIATDGTLDTYADNGPFTLTIDGAQLNINDSDLVPESFALYANYPNPFNP